VDGGRIRSWIPKGKEGFDFIYTKRKKREIRMIINTYPMGDQQHTPKFVRHFYEAIQEFLRQNAEKFDSPRNDLSVYAAFYASYVCTPCPRKTSNEKQQICTEDLTCRLYTAWTSKEQPELLLWETTR
jgi:hypothetical protein